MGHAVSGAGDLNGDGYDDVLVGAPKSGLQNWGAIFAFSGLDGSTLYQIIGTSKNDRLGYSVSRIGDLNGDGVSEWIAGAPKGHPDDYFVIYSGREAILEFQTYSASKLGEFCAAATGLGDVDGDGIPDYAVGAPNSDWTIAEGNPPSRVHVYSGMFGNELYRIEGKRPSDSFGSTLAGTDDVDGDGIQDLLVGAPGGTYASLHSGATGKLIHELVPSFAVDGPGYCGFGQSVSQGGDWDGDGVRDLLVGVPGMQEPLTFKCAGDRGRVLVYSARSGELIQVHEGLVGDSLGFSVAGFEDVTGDGVDEIIVGAPNGFSNYVSVLSRAKMSLQVRPPFLKISKTLAGAVNFKLNAGQENGGLTYWMLGSASGIEPGSLGTGVLPLVMDSYFAATLFNPSQQAFVDFRGELGPAGRANAKLNLASGLDPSLAGASLFHAFAVFGPAGDLAFVSNPVSTLLIELFSALPSCELEPAKVVPYGALLEFVPKSTEDLDGVIVSYFWEFGDGQTADTPIAFHAYETPGLFEVRLTVTDDDGNSSTCITKQDVLEQRQPPSCAFEITGPTLGSPFKFVFDGSLSMDGDAKITNYEWDFGDGNTFALGLGIPVFHEYSGPGDYLVTLTVTDDDMASSTCTELVSVN